MLKMFRRLSISNVVATIFTIPEKIGNYLAYGTTSRTISTTTDFTNWNNVSVAPQNTHKVISKDGIYYAISRIDGKVYRSSNLISWDTVYSTSTWFINNIKIVDNKIFVFGATRGFTNISPCITSVDGITWSSFNVGGFIINNGSHSSEIKDIIKVNDIYIFAGDSSDTYTPRNVFSKSTNLTSAFQFYSTTAYMSIMSLMHDSSNIYAVGNGWKTGDGSINRIYKSDSLNPTSFSTIYSSVGTIYNFNGVEHLDDNYLIVSDSLRLLKVNKQTGAISNILITSNANFKDQSLIKANNVYVIAGSSHIYKSLDGINWEPFGYPNNPGTLFFA